MFLRTVKVTSSSGTVHEYVRVVTSVREDGKICQKVIANLGRRDTLQAILPQLQRLLQGERDDDADRQLTRQLGLAEDVEIQDASTWGPVLVVQRHFSASRSPKTPCGEWPLRLLAVMPPPQEPSVSPIFPRSSGGSGEVRFVRTLLRRGQHDCSAIRGGTDVAVITQAFIEQ